MGSIMWWIGVFALALFFELWHRVGIRRACSIIWEFAGEIGPRDAAVRRRRHLWRNFGVRDDEDDCPPFCVRDYGHGIQANPDLGPDYARHYREADDDTPVTWPIQHWSSRR